MCKELLQQPKALQKVATRQLKHAQNTQQIISIQHLSSGFGGVWTIDSLPLVFSLSSLLALSLLFSLNLGSNNQQQQQQPVTQWEIEEDRAGTSFGLSNLHPIHLII